MTFKRGDKVWWTDDRGLRHAAVVLQPQISEHHTSAYVKLDTLTSKHAVGWRSVARLSPRTEHIPELDGPAQPQRGEGAG